VNKKRMCGAVDEAAITYLKAIESVDYEPRVWIIR
jgi:hypothetical protein